MDFLKSTEFGGKLRNWEALKTLINITKVQTGNEDLQTNLAGGVRSLNWILINFAQRPTLFFL